MKKLLCILLALSLTLSLAACAGGEKPAETAEDPTQSEPEEAAQTEDAVEADAEAVDEAEEDGQNPVMNFVGEYQCDRAHATVACTGVDEALITIEWGGSVSEMAQWDIVGQLDTETLTITYSGCTKSIVTYNADGEVVSQVPEYEDGTGTIVFHEDGTFTWHEDQSEYGEDLVFEWAL